jgi:hypothetical protein
MSQTVTVDRDDLTRLLLRLERGRYGGITPGEAQAEQRIRAALDRGKARAEAASEPPAPEQVVELPLSESLGETYNVLIEAGFDTHESIALATDEELLAIDGIGPARLRKIREVLNDG